MGYKFVGSLLLEHVLEAHGSTECCYGENRPGNGPSTASSVSEIRSRQVREAKGIIEVPKGKQTSVGRHARTVELQLQSKIESHPESSIVFFTPLHHPSPALLMPITPLKGNRNRCFQITLSWVHLGNVG
jgi:hypothetical protein